MPIKYTINDAVDDNGTKTIKISASLGTISVFQEFVINDTLDRTMIITTMQGLLQTQVRINNQFNNIKSRIGQDF